LLFWFFCVCVGLGFLFWLPRGRLSDTSPEMVPLGREVPDGLFGSVESLRRGGSHAAGPHCREVVPYRVPSIQRCGCLECWIGGALGCPSVHLSVPDGATPPLISIIIIFLCVEDDYDWVSPVACSVPGPAGRTRENPDKARSPPFGCPEENPQYKGHRGVPSCPALRKKK